LEQVFNFPESLKIVLTSNPKEICKTIADFLITSNLLFRNFSKQANTLAALGCELGRALFHQFRERFKKVRVKLKNHRPAKLSYDYTVVAYKFEQIENIFPQKPKVME